jgi:short-subunit dehydrogenase
VTYAAPRATRTDAAVAFAGLIAKTKMSMDSPEHVARQIWRAIASGHDSVYAPAPERFYVLIQRLFRSSESNMQFVQGLPTPVARGMGGGRGGGGNVA